MECKVYIVYFWSWYIVYIILVVDNSRKVINWLIGEWLIEWVIDCLFGLFVDLWIEWRVSIWLIDWFIYLCIE